MTKYCFLIAVALFSSGYLFAQKSVKAKESAFWPKNAGPEINSPSHEVNPLLSEDGCTLYFMRINHPENRFGSNDSQDIWMSQRASSRSPWSTAVRMPDALNRIQHNSLYYVSADQNTFIIAGRYSKTRQRHFKRGLSYVQRIDSTTFSEPTKMNIPRFERLNKGTYSTVSFHPSGEFMTAGINRNFDSHRQKIHFSYKKPNGKWRKLKRVRYPKSGYSSEAPVWSQDKKSIYFSTRLNKGIGNFDIYRIDALNDKYTKWSEPILYTDTINTVAWDSYLYATSNGEFQAYSTELNTRGGADINIRKVFESKPYLDYGITIRDSRSQQPLDPKYVQKIAYSYDGQEYTQIDSQLNLQAFRIPLKSKIRFMARVPYFSSDTIIVDATELEEYDTGSLAIHVTPVPYVDLNIKLTTTNPSRPFKLDKLRRITINGVAPEEPKYGYETSSVSFKVFHGQNQRIDLAADGFSSLPLLLKLSDVSEYQVIDTVVKMRPNEIKVVLATISGTVVDKKTGKPLNNKKPYEIVVNDTTRTNESQDTTQTAKYLVNLDPGRIYTIGVNRKGYAPIYEILDLSKEKGNVKVIKDLLVVPLEVGQSIKINNILFETGKASLKPSSFPELDRLAEFLNDYEIKAEIAGHTDNVGKAANNLKLSENRAKSVAEYLISKGVESNKITFKGYGMTKPVADNKTAKGKAENRRVEFTVLDIVIED